MPAMPGQHPRPRAATYRVQLHAGFTFDDAAAVTGYLADLGISHLYCSPYLQAAAGSTHGYDVVDHQRVNQELGGAAAHERFCARLGQARLGQVLDIVPNHMSLVKENRYWWDVLENGVFSRYASYFDIEWQSHEERLRNKVLVPVLAEQYGRVLQSGGIKVVRHGNSFQVEYSEQKLPAAPQSLPVILAKAAEYAKSDTLNFLAASFGRLPAPEYADRRTILARHRDKAAVAVMPGGARSWRRAGRSSGCTEREQGRAGRLSEPAKLPAGVLEDGRPAAWIQTLLRCEHAGGTAGGAGTRL